MFIKPKVTVLAHSGQFHADDVFAVATLCLLLEDSRRINIVRTRDDSLIQKAEYVVDVGGVYDPDKNRFDHHQIGGAGKRDNGVPYASFGLVWMKYGTKICRSEKVSTSIDQKLVQPIDASDNGVAISTRVFEKVSHFDVQSLIRSMNPDWMESHVGIDKIFLSAVEFAKKIISREIKLASDNVLGEGLVFDAYNKSEDKRIVVFDTQLPWEQVISKFPEPLYVIFPKESGWRIKAVRNEADGFENRKNFPASWAGKRSPELSMLTGVPGGIFCHNNLFVAEAQTKEGALAMARIATDA